MPREDPRDLALLAAVEREADEWRAVEAIEVDESDFVPEILPEEVSDVFCALAAGDAPWPRAETSPLERAIREAAHG